MPQTNVARLAFNRGKVSPLALARTDIDRVELSASEQTNFVPRVLGSMMLRPGWQHLGTALGTSYNLPFVKSTDDTALVELTNESMRVWVDDAVVTRNAVSTTVRGGDFSADVSVFTKLTDPADLPGADSNGVAFSADGKLMAVAHDAANSRLVTVYSVDDTTLTVLATQPASGPTTGVGCGVAFSPDGSLLALASDAAGGYDVWSITGTGSDATFSHVTTTALNPGDTARGIAFSTDGTWMAVAHDTSPYVSIFAVSGTTFTLQDDPASLPAGNGQSVAFSNDGMFMAVAHATTPFVTIYEINGSTFTKLSDPASLPASTGNGVAFSRDGNWMAVAHTTTPFVTIYAIDGTTFTKETNPSTLPDGTGLGVAFSSDSQFLAVVHSTSLFLSHYRLVSDVWTKQTDPADAPDGIGNGVAFSPNNQLMVVAHNSANYLTVYEGYQWLDLDESGAASTYLAGTFNVAFDKVTTGDQSSADYTNATVRQVISNNDLTRSGSSIKVTFKAGSAGNFRIERAYIGYSATTGQSYDFSSAPTKLTFNGGNEGFLISSSAIIVSDIIPFEFDASRRIVVTYDTWATGVQHISGLTDGAADSQAFYKTGVNQASSLDVSGYTTSSNDYLGVRQIHVLDEDAEAGLSLVGTGFHEAKRAQAVSILNTDKDVEHGVTVTVAQGHASFRLGSEYGDDDLIRATTLSAGVYSFAFTPTTNLFFLEFSASTKYPTIITGCQIDGAGDMTLPTEYTEDDLINIRYTQSGDVIYVACKDRKPKKLERRAAKSWAIVDYLPEDGPFRDDSTNGITLTASALTGEITLTASRPVFSATHVGALFRINSLGQATDDDFTGESQFSNYIKVTGVEDTRKITIVRSGTWSATVTLQRSVSEPGTWVDVATFTGNGTATYNDELDNQIIYYRIGIDAGDYTSGTASVSLSYASGTDLGVARVTGYTSPTLVDAIVLNEFGGTSAFESWSEGMWSDRRGYPSCVAIYEGRLCWAGKDQVLLSESDGYENFDDTVEGDAAPILRKIGEGPVDDINWLLPLQRLLVGTEGSERSCRSNSFDEPLTVENFNMKPASTQGSGAVGPIIIDSSGAFVDRTGTRVFQLVYNFDTYDYSVGELTRLVPETAAAGIRKIVVQRRPDTRVHCVLNDGTVAMLVFEREEDTICWIDIETDGEIVDACILPDTPEDAVYYTVKRTINSIDSYYLERWAIEDDCQGDMLNKQADSFIIYDDVSTTTITGLDHLEGETVVVWGDGKDLGTATVSSGSITLSTAVEQAVIGLPYTARYRSTKLAYAAGGGTALNARKRIEKIGLILYKTHHKGLRIGDSFDNLRAMPTVVGAKAVVVDTVHDEFDWDQNAYNTKWSPDSRLCLEAQAPRPVTILAATMNIETNG